MPVSACANQFTATCPDCGKKFTYRCYNFLCERCMQCETLVAQCKDCAKKAKNKSTFSSKVS
jgi:hypothetical protein